MHLNLSLRISTYADEDYVNVSVLFYHEEDRSKSISGSASSEEGEAAGNEGGGAIFVPDADLCSLEFPPEASDRSLHTFAARKVDGVGGEGQEWEALVHADYKVLQSGVQNVLFQVCPSLMSLSSVALAGEISFKNPYGYLPGRFYGYLPFEGARFFAFLAFFMLYLGMVVKHRKHLLRLHYAILGVLVVATAEALSWFLAFSHMNSQGTPYCCPFPAVVISAMVFELIQKTASRALLLLICLGYGIARPSLQKGEWFSLGTLTLLYLGATILDEASEIGEAQQIGGSGGGGGERWRWEQQDVVVVPGVVVRYCVSFLDLHEPGDDDEDSARAERDVQARVVHPPVFDHPRVCHPLWVPHACRAFVAHWLFCMAVDATLG